MHSATVSLNMRIFGIKLQISVRVFILLAVAAMILPWRWLFAMLTAASIHEMGHLLVLRLQKVTVEGVQIDISGARILTAFLSPRQELLCACAGPGAAALLIGLGRLYPELAICAFIQSAYNLIPIMPFDGGRIMRCVINSIFPQYIAEKVLTGTEILICSCAVFLGVISLLNNLFYLSVIALAFAALTVKRKIACNGGVSAVQ